MSFCSKADFMNYLLYQKTDRQQLDGSMANMKEAHATQMLPNTPETARAAIVMNTMPLNFSFESAASLPVNVSSVVAGAQ